MFAEVEDIARFVCAGMTCNHKYDHKLLKVETIQLIHKPHVEIPGLFGFVAENYGFGHFIETLSDGRKAVWHGGQGHGWMTHFHAIPESGSGIIILTNSQRSWPFMAQILNEWMEWLGIEPVKMSQIIFATKVLWVFIIVVVMISLWQVYDLIKGLLRGRRRLAPLELKSRKRSWFEIMAGVILIGSLTWSILQPYLFISSLFPSASVWTGFSLLALSLINLISTLFPYDLS